MQLDDKFFERADAVIHLVNDQLDDAPLGMTSASLLYAAARFNSWVSATGFENSAEMEAAKQDVIDYFVEQYRLMLTENLDDYVANFDGYMRPTN